MTWNEDPLEAPAGGRDELQAIVGRATTRRRRVVLVSASVVGAAALVGGTGIGYGLADHHTTTSVVAGAPLAPGAKGANQSSAGAAVSNGSTATGSAPVPGGSGFSSGLPVTTKLQKLFIRDNAGVALRAFEDPVQTVASPGNCGFVSPGPLYGVEISTPGMVGQLGLSSLSSTPKGSIVATDAEYLGQQEGSPVAVVLVQTGSGVTSVAARFDGAGGATDRMVPVSGLAALAVQLPASAASSAVGPVAQLTVYGAGGRVLTTRSVAVGIQYAQTPGATPGATFNCPCLPAEGDAVAPSGAASASVGSAQVGSSGTGSGGTVSSPAQPPSATATAPVYCGGGGTTSGSGGSTGSGASGGSGGSSGSGSGSTSGGAPTSGGTVSSGTASSTDFIHPTPASVPAGN